MNNIGTFLHYVRVSASPKGLGSDRKAPELGREPLLGFCSSVKSGAGSRSASLLSSPTVGKTLPNSRKRESARCFPRVQEDNVSGAAYDLSTQKKSRKNYVVSLLISCAAPGSSLTRRVGRCPTPKRRMIKILSTH